MHREREIDRYLAVGLSVAAAGRMHSHLRNCDACRRYHDEQVALLRALAGRVGQATRQEDERTLQRALDGIGAPRLGAGAAVRSTSPTRARPRGGWT